MKYKLDVVYDYIKNNYNKEINIINKNIIKSIYNLNKNLDNIQLNEFFSLYVYQKIRSNFCDIATISNINNADNYIKKSLKYNFIYNIINNIYKEFKFKEFFNKNKKLNLELKLNEYEKFFKFKYKKYFEDKVNIYLNIYLENKGIYKNNLHYNEFSYYIFYKISKNIIFVLKEINMNDLDDYINTLIKNIENNKINYYHEREFQSYHSNYSICYTKEYKEINYDTNLFYINLEIIEYNSENFFDYYYNDYVRLLENCLPII